MKKTLKFVALVGFCAVLFTPALAIAQYYCDPDYEICPGYGGYGRPAAPVGGCSYSSVRVDIDD